MGTPNVKEANAGAKAKPDVPCDPSKPTCKSAKEPIKPRVGVVLSIYPVLFKKSEYPQDTSQFSPIEEKLYGNEFFLLADGLQEAVIAIQLIDIDKSQKKLAKTTASGGEIVIKLDNPQMGMLEHKPDGKTPSETGAQIRVPVAGITGVYQKVFYKTAVAIGPVTISCSIDKPAASYVYVATVTIPPKENWHNSLSINMRQPTLNDKGYDVQRIQWYLRRAAYLKNHRGADGECNGHFDKRCERAINRLQRRALGPYRNKRNQAADQQGGFDAGQDNLYTGQVSGTADLETIKEIVKWFKNDWCVPLGRLGTKMVLFDTQYKKLRSDIVDKFNLLKQDILNNGGTLDDRGSTLRNFTAEVTSSRSHTSCHYCGLAIDIAENDPPYYPVRDPDQTSPPYSAPFWTVYAKSTDPTKHKEKGFEKHYIWLEGHHDHPRVNGKDKPIPAGNYYNLTEVFMRNNFESIKPHADYDTNTETDQGQEWWHFQFILDHANHFQDEVELVDSKYTEAFLKGPNVNLSDEKLDGPAA